MIMMMMMDSIITVAVRRQYNEEISSVDLLLAVAKAHLNRGEDDLRRARWTLGLRVGSEVVGVKKMRHSVQDRVSKLRDIAACIQGSIESTPSIAR
jgi:hypothetical protein